MLNSTHPIIPNADEYMLEKKYIYITSHDINKDKYPSTSNFEIELPQDYCNVQSIALSSFNFPSNINTFSPDSNNVRMTFIIDNIYTPSGSHPNYDYEYAIYIALTEKLNSANKEFLVTIGSGNYSKQQFQNELTNKFNMVVSDYIINYLRSIGDTTNEALFLINQYSEFIIKFNIVSEKIWYGNKSSGFVLTNNYATTVEFQQCSASYGFIPLSNENYWGLPEIIGLPRRPTSSTKTDNLNDARFFYFPTIVDGIWLKPSQPDSPYVYFIESAYKWNPLYEKYNFFMEIDKLNCIDQCARWDSKIVETQESNITNGIVDSTFSRIFIYCNPNTSDNFYYNGTSADIGVKIFNPPMERIRRLRIRFKYHYGAYVSFGNLPYSFTLAVTMFRPQSLKKFSMYRPESFR